MRRRAVVRPEQAVQPRLAHTGFVGDVGDTERAVEMGPKNGEVTAASIKQGLCALEGETLQASTAPLTYTQGKPTANICYFVMSIQGGKFTTPEGAQPQCAPESVNQFLPKPA